MAEPTSNGAPTASTAPDAADAATVLAGRMSTPFDQTIDAASRAYAGMVTSAMSHPGGGSGVAGVKQRQIAEQLDKLPQQHQAERAKFEAEHPEPKPVHLEAWTKKPPEPDPVRQFGSLASGLAILAGALTRTPLTTALNASAEAMKAIRSNDLRAYEDAKNTWKDNADIALKNSEQEWKAYSNAYEKMKTNWAEGRADLTTAATAWGNVAATQHADDSATWAHMSALGAAVKELRQNRDQMEEDSKKKAWEIQRAAEILGEKGINPGSATEQQIKAAQSQAGIDREVMLKTVTARQTAEQQAIAARMARTGQSYDSARADVAAEMSAAKGASANPHSNAGRRKTISESLIKDNPNLANDPLALDAQVTRALNVAGIKPGSEAEFLTETAADLIAKDPNLSKPAADAQARVLLKQTKEDPAFARLFQATAAANPNMTTGDVTTATIRSLAAAKAGGAVEGRQAVHSNLDDAAIDYAAQEYINTGKLPSGYSSGQMKTEVINRAASVMQAAGITPAQFSALAPERKAVAASLAKNVAFESNIARGVKELDAMLDQAKFWATDLPIGTFQKVNEALLAGETYFGSAEANNYKIAMQNVALLYGRLQSGPMSNAMLPVAVIQQGMSRFGTMLAPAQFEGERVALHIEAENMLAKTQDEINNGKRQLESFGLTLSTSGYQRPEGTPTILPGGARIPPSLPPSLSGKNLQFSTSANQYRDKDNGKIYDIEGNEVK